MKEPFGATFGNTADHCAHGHRGMLLFSCIVLMYIWFHHCNLIPTKEVVLRLFITRSSCNVPTFPVCPNITFEVFKVGVNKLVL